MERRVVLGSDAWFGHERCFTGLKALEEAAGSVARERECAERLVAIHHSQPQGHRVGPERPIVDRRLSGWRILTDATTFAYERAGHAKETLRIRLKWTAQVSMSAIELDVTQNRTASTRRGPHPIVR